MRPLHIIKAGFDRVRGRGSFDIGKQRWRGEGTEGPDGHAKADVAYRAALCWNVCIGWPNTVLENGMLDKQDELTFNVLDAAPYSDAQNTAVERLREHMKKRDALYDDRWKEKP